MGESPRSSAGTGRPRRNALRPAPELELLGPTAQRRAAYFFSAVSIRSRRIALRVCGAPAKRPVRHSGSRGLLLRRTLWAFTARFDTRALRSARHPSSATVWLPAARLGPVQSSLALHRRRGGLHTQCHAADCKMGCRAIGLVRSRYAIRPVAASRYARHGTRQAGCLGLDRAGHGARRIRHPRRGRRTPVRPPRSGSGRAHRTAHQLQAANDFQHTPWPEQGRVAVLVSSAARRPLSTPRAPHNASLRLLSWGLQGVHSDSATSGSSVVFLISVTAIWECSSRIASEAESVLRTKSS